MDTREVMRLCEKQGIILKLEAGKLLSRGAKAQLTPELISLLRTHKAQIVHILSAHQIHSSPKADETISTKENAEKLGKELITLPLSGITHQAFSWQYRHYSHDFSGVTLVFDTPLHMQALERALLHLVNSQPAFRIRFAYEPQQWKLQYVPGQYDQPPLCQIPVLSMHETAFEAHFHQVCTAVIQKTNIATLPLAQFIYFRTTAPLKDRLVMVMPHAICDGASIKIMVHTLYHLYQQALKHRLPVMPSVPSMVDYLALMTSRLASPALPQRLHYWHDVPTWKERLRAARLQLLHQDAPPDANDYQIKHFATESLRIPSIQVTALHTLFEKLAIHTKLGIPLLVLHALSDQIGAGILPFWNFEDGRDIVSTYLDVSNMIGMLAFPVIGQVKLDPTQSLNSFITQEKEQFTQMKMQALDFQAVYHSALPLKDSTIAELRDLPHPELSFNYLGQQYQNGKTELHGWQRQSVPNLFSTENRLICSLDVVFFYEDEDLVINIRYQHHFYNKALIWGWLDQIQQLAHQVFNADNQTLASC